MIPVSRESFSGDPCSGGLAENFSLIRGVSQSTFLANVPFDCKIRKISFRLVLKPFLKRKDFYLCALETVCLYLHILTSVFVSALHPRDKFSPPPLPADRHREYTRDFSSKLLF